VLKLEPVSSDYFHKVGATFQFDAGRFKAPSRDSIVMESDLMTLKGGGSVDFDMNLNLYLSLPSFGLPQIPVVSDILGLLIDNIAVFHVTGPLESPRVTVVPMQDILSIFKEEER
jgi:hypothetical protein